jgi:predicted AAA+ superfamily ATPase
MWIERTLGTELKRLAASFPIVVLTGPRQVGKTSLLEKVFPGHRFLSLDDAQNAEAAESRPRDLLESFPPPVIIDEIQYAPSLLRHLKVAVDRRRGENGLFFLSGSQSFPMMQAVSESLAGRAAVVPFLGLSAEEWSACTPLASRSTYADLLWRGSYPGLWADMSRPLTVTGGTRATWPPASSAMSATCSTCHAFATLNGSCAPARSGTGSC